jgi:hypothetical protein
MLTESFPEPPLILMSFDAPAVNVALTGPAADEASSVPMSAAEVAPEKVAENRIPASPEMFTVFKDVLLSATVEAVLLEALPEATPVELIFRTSTPS